MTEVATSKATDSLEVQLLRMGQTERQVPLKANTNLKNWQLLASAETSQCSNQTVEQAIPRMLMKTTKQSASTWWRLRCVTAIETNQSKA